MSDRAIALRDEDLSVPDQPAEPQRLMVPTDAELAELLRRAVEASLGGERQVRELLAHMADGGTLIPTTRGHSNQPDGVSAIASTSVMDPRDVVSNAYALTLPQPAGERTMVWTGNGHSVSFMPSGVVRRHRGYVRCGGVAEALGDTGQGAMWAYDRAANLLTRQSPVPDGVSCVFEYEFDTISIVGGYATSELISQLPSHLVSAPTQFNHGDEVSSSIQPQVSVLSQTVSVVSEAVSAPASMTVNFAATVSGFTQAMQRAADALAMFTGRVRRPGPVGDAGHGVAEDGYLRHSECDDCRRAAGLIT